MQQFWLALVLCQAGWQESCFERLLIKNQIKAAAVVFTFPALQINMKYFILLLTEYVNALFIFTPALATATSEDQKICASCGARKQGFQQLFGAKAKPLCCLRRGKAFWGESFLRGKLGSRLGCVARTPARVWSDSLFLQIPV